MASKAQFPMEQSVAGEFKRQDDAFRGWVTEDGRSGYPAAAGGIISTYPWPVRGRTGRSSSGSSSSWNRSSA